jgi:ADP-ribose pyrophosphatase
MTARSAKAPPIPAHPGLDVLADEVVWNGRFPLQRVRFTYTRFDGSKSGELTWELWRRFAGVAILPYDPVADVVALIEQFRLPALAAGLDPIMIECPAGLREPGEAPEDVARRETREETALEPDRFELICRTMLMQGGCDETMHYYAARVRLPDALSGGTHGLVEEHEDTRVLIIPAAEAFAMLDDNRIMNTTAMVCLWWLRHHRARLRQDWTR